MIGQINKWGRRNEFKMSPSVWTGSSFHSRESRKEKRGDNTAGDEGQHPSHKSC